MSRATQDTERHTPTYIRGYHPILLTFPGIFCRSLLDLFLSYNPNLAETRLVWAVPCSLAATQGIIFIFYSWSYLDVSVHSVDSIRPIYSSGSSQRLIWVGFPIRKSPDLRLFAPTRGLSQLITSFIVSRSQGIRLALLLTFLSNHRYKLLLLITTSLFNMSKNFFSINSYLQKLEIVITLESNQKKPLK